MFLKGASHSQQQQWGKSIDAVTSQVCTLHRGSQADNSKIPVLMGYPAGANIITESSQCASEVCQYAPEICICNGNTLEFRGESVSVITYKGLSARTPASVSL